jgi:ABC-type polysaccharide/polyol phosphate export permease
MVAVPVVAPKPVPIATVPADDLVEGLRQWRLWARLGWLEVKRRYRRTMIGPFWSAISLGVFVAALGGVGAGLWSQHTRDYLPFLAAGMVVWVMVSSILGESCSLFIGGTSLFRQMRFNYSVLAYALVYRNAIVFAHNLSVYALVQLAFAPGKFGPVNLLALPALALVLMNAVWVALLVGMACLRFRDLQQLINTLIQIAMFATPILWPPESVQGITRILYVELNPLYHVIAIVRAPLMGELPSLTTCLAMLAMTVGGWGVTYAFFRYFRKRIAYWS